MRSALSDLETKEDLDECENVKGLNGKKDYHSTSVCTKLQIANSKEVN